MCRTVVCARRGRGRASEGEEYVVEGGGADVLSRSPSSSETGESGLVEVEFEFEVAVLEVLPFTGARRVEKGTLFQRRETVSRMKREL